ncbi:MAG: gfo/Idh/MocA family oxidoreductase [Planctomycetota bacterium]|nr:MAG: gfo/Idh/MocA family oxidoreductase [Planctomycetota bacterium]
MVQKSDGMSYAPQAAVVEKVVAPGEFRFAAMALDHGHIYGQCNGLTEAGADLVAVYDPDPAKVEAFRLKYPQARAVRDEREILEDDSIQMVAAAAIPNRRGPLGCRVMDHGKHYFTDKCPFTTLEQLAQAQQVVAATGKKYAVYFSERLHVESAMHAGDLIDQGAIGRPIQVIGLGPHRLSKASRPDWFFRKEEYGGILCDIGSHQIEQFLHYTGNADATIQASKVGNFHNPDVPELEDFGDLTLIGANGASGYHRVDWFTPDGLRTWGDGRTLILGTEGYIELRKYLDVGVSSEGDWVILVNGDGEHRYSVAGKVGFPFFGRLIRDCLDGTEIAMTQQHAFKAAELCLIAQARAEVISPI